MRRPLGFPLSVGLLVLLAGLASLVGADSEVPPESGDKPEMEARGPRPPEGDVASSTVLGAVNEPGEIEFPEDGNLSLWEALQNAKGFTGRADIDRISITRKDSEGEDVTLTMKELRDPEWQEAYSELFFRRLVETAAKRHDQWKRFKLIEGDVVFVPERMSMF